VTASGSSGGSFWGTPPGSSAEPFGRYAAGVSDDPTTKREGRWLRPDRMEAFSDGVFAIAITLLVLDLVVPEIEGDVGHALVDQWPTYLAYFVSFASIGAAWILHSVVTDHLDRVDSIVLRLNLLPLFVVSILPFTTRMLGEYLHDADAERIGVTIYVLAMSAMGSVVWRYAVAQRLIKADRSEEQVRAMTTKLTPSLGFYAGRDRDRPARADRRGVPVPGDRALPADPVPCDRAARPQTRPTAVRPNLSRSAPATHRRSA
jgi:TMEM175 potassium channel family protein